MLFKRPLFYGAVSLASGLCLGVYVHSVLYWLLATSVLLALFYQHTHFRKFLFLLFFLVMGVGLGHFENTRASKQEALPRAVFCDRVSLEGQVVGFLEWKDRGRSKMASFQIETHWIKTRTQKFYISKKLQVYWFGSNPNLRYGDLVWMSGKLEAPRGASNFGQFDFKAYLQRHGIEAVFNVFGFRSGKIRAHEFSGFDQLLRGVEALRKNFHQKIVDALHAPYDSIMSAMLIGVWTNLPSVLREEFARTGLIHILSISGLHFGTICVFLLGCFSYLRLPRKITLWLTLLIVIFYALLAGLRYPVIRSAIMIALFLISMLMGYRKDSLNVLGCAAILTLIFVPSSLWDLSFILSYGSVFAIFSLSPRLLAHIEIPPATLPPRVLILLHALANSLCVSLAVTLVLSPILIWHFQTFSPICLLANLIVVPLFLLALIEGVWLVVLGFYPSLILSVASWLTEFTLEIALRLIHFFAFVPGGTWHIPRFSGFWMIIYYVILSIIFLKLKKKWFWIIVGILFLFQVGLLTIVRVQKKVVQHCEMVILKTRDYRTAFFQFQNQTVLLNAGREKFPDESLRVVIPFLRWQGTNQLEALVIGSVYRRDWGGLEVLSREKLFRQLYVPIRFNSKVVRKDGNVHWDVGVKPIRIGKHISFSSFHKNFRRLESPLTIQCGNVTCWYIPRVHFLEEALESMQTLPDVVWIPEINEEEVAVVRKYAPELGACRWVIGKLPRSFQGFGQTRSLWVLSEQGAFRLVSSSRLTND